MVKVWVKYLKCNINFVPTANNICDVIKQNESELANTVFQIQPNKAYSFFCFLLFLQSFNCLYILNQLPNLFRVFNKLKPIQYPSRKCQKNKIHIFWLQTHFAWSHHILWLLCGVIWSATTQLWFAKLVCVYISMMFLYTMNILWVYKT